MIKLIAEPDVVEPFIAHLAPILSNSERIVKLVFALLADFAITCEENCEHFRFSIAHSRKVFTEKNGRGSLQEPIL